MTLSKTFSLDNSTQSIQTVDYAHHEIHSGSSFFIHNSATIANNEVNTISFKTPNSTKQVHFTYEVSASGAGTFDLLESVTSVAGGTASTPLNRYRDSTTTSTVTAPLKGDTTGADPVVPTGGTNIYSIELGAGQRDGGEDRSTHELILKKNAIYLLRFTSTGAGNKTSLIANWYEHTPKS